jgi:hypothetical protein
MKKEEHIENKKQSLLSNFDNPWVLYIYPISVKREVSEQEQMEQYQIIQLKNLTRMEIFLKK